MLHYITSGLTCVYNVPLTSSQGGSEAETLLLKCCWETRGSLSIASNSKFVSFTTVAVSLYSHRSSFRAPGCACPLWRSLFTILGAGKQTRKHRGEPQTGLVSRLSLAKGLKTRNLNRLPGSAPALFSGYVSLWMVPFLHPSEEIKSLVWRQWKPCVTWFSQEGLSTNEFLSAWSGGYTSHATKPCWGGCAVQLI